MKRAEFSKKTRLQAFERCKGICECGCNQKIITSAEYHHIIAAAIGGSNELDNCQVLSKKCHRRITTTKTIKITSKATRIYEKRAGVRKGRGFRKPPPGFKHSFGKWRDQ